MEFYPAYLPDPKDEIALIKIYGAPTVAITINTAKMNEKDAREYAEKYKKELEAPTKSTNNTLGSVPAPPATGNNQ